MAIFDVMDECCGLDGFKTKTFMVCDDASTYGTRNAFLNWQEHCRHVCEFGFGQRDASPCVFGCQGED